MIWLGIIYAIVSLVFYVWVMGHVRSAFTSVDVEDRIIALGLSAVWPVTVTLAYILLMRARD